MNNQNMSLLKKLLAALLCFILCMSTALVALADASQETESTIPTQEGFEDPDKNTEDGQADTTAPTEPPNAPLLRRAVGNGPGILIVQIDGFPVQDGSVTNLTRARIYNLRDCAATLYSENGAPLETLYTAYEDTSPNDNGRLYFTGLEPETTYLLRQIQTADGYRMAENFTYTIRVGELKSLNNEDYCEITIDEYPTYASGGAVKTPLVIVNVQDPLIEQVIDYEDNEHLEITVDPGVEFIKKTTVELPMDVYYYGLWEYEKFVLTDLLDEHLEITGEVTLIYAGYSGTTNFSENDYKITVTQEGSKTKVTAELLDFTNLRRLHTSQWDSFGTRLILEIPVKVKDNVEFDETIENVVTLSFINSLELEDEIESNAVFIRPDIELIDITVEKTWENMSGEKPGIWLQLYQNGAPHQDPVLLKGANTHTFINLRKYDKAGGEYHYTVEEIAVEGYNLSDFDIVYDLEGSPLRILNRKKATSTGTRNPGGDVYPGKTDPTPVVPPTEPPVDPQAPLEPEEPEETPEVPDDKPNPNTGR